MARPEELVPTLAAADVLVNTYWVGFDHRGSTHAGAVANAIKLFRAAREADVRRVVHVSITNPAPDSDLPYFRGKAEVEQALVGPGLMRGMLDTDSPPAGTTRLTEWISRHRDTLGTRYASELARRRDRLKSYGSLKEGA